MIKAQFYKKVNYHKQIVHQHLSQNIETLVPGPWDGVWLTHEIHPFPTCYLVKCGRSKSKGMRVIAELRLKKMKNDLSHPAFQGHSRSLEPTRIDWLPMTSY